MNLDPKTLAGILAVLVPEELKTTIDHRFRGNVGTWNWCRDEMLKNIEIKSSQIISEIEKAMEEKDGKAKPSAEGK